MCASTISGRRCERQHDQHNLRFDSPRLWSSPAVLSYRSRLSPSLLLSPSPQGIINEIRVDRARRISPPASQRYDHSPTGRRKHRDELRQKLRDGVREKPRKKRLRPAECGSSRGGDRAYSSHP
jgi:hypothetical protein